MVNVPYAAQERSVLREKLAEAVWLAAEWEAIAIAALERLESAEQSQEEENHD